MANEFNFINDIRAIYDIWKIIRQQKFDIVHINSSKAGFLARIAAKLAGAPVVIFTIHGLSFDFELRPRFAPLLLFFEKLLSPITDGFIAVAGTCRDEFIENKVCAQDKIRVIHHAFEYELIDKATQDKGKLSEIGLSENDFVVGSVGHFRKAKGYEYLVETAELVKKENDRIKFVIIGEGTEQEKITNLVREKGLDDTVKIPGSRSDVPELLKVMNLFLRPSIHEGLGFAILEAMYAGLPCITTDVSGAREIIEDGKTGYIVPVRDSKMMAEKIVYLYNNPTVAESLGSAARASVKEGFSPEGMVDKIEEYYLELLKKKGTWGRRKSLKEAPNVREKK
jgi:glycosyltransferase involved in cell wall biosynthesis